MQSTLLSLYIQGRSEFNDRNFSNSEVFKNQEKVRLNKSIVVFSWIRQMSKRRLQ